MDEALSDLRIFCCVWHEHVRLDHLLPRVKQNELIVVVLDDLLEEQEARDRMRVVRILKIRIAADGAGFLFAFSHLQVLPED